MQLSHIVVATDASDAGRQAVRTGLDLSSRSAARLTVMRVVAVESPPAAGRGRNRADAAERADGAAELERLRCWLEPELFAAGPEAQVEVAVAFGDPAAEICRFAEARDADLLILGRKQRSPAARLLLGDTADLVLRRSRVPCLFVQPGTPPITQLLVAVDRSPQALRVFAAGRDFAAAAGAALRVTTVGEFPRARSCPISSPRPPSATRMSSGSVIRPRRTRARREQPRRGAPARARRTAERARDSARDGRSTAMTTISLPETSSPPRVKVPMRGYLGGLHDQWRDEVRGAVDPACEPAAGTWRRWRAVDYLQHGFKRRFERERRAVASLHQRLSPEQSRHLWVGGELLGQLVDSLDRVGFCQREAEFVPTMLNILNALDYWCREVDDALGPVRWGDVSPESRGLFETITYDPVLLGG